MKRARSEKRSNQPKHQEDGPSKDPDLLVLVYGVETGILSAHFGDICKQAELAGVLKTLYDLQLPLVEVEAPG